MHSHTLIRRSPPPPPPQRAPATATTTLQQLTQRIYAGGRSYPTTATAVNTGLTQPVPNSSLSSSYLLSRGGQHSAQGPHTQGPHTQYVPPQPMYSGRGSDMSGQVPLASLLRPVKLRDVNQIYSNRSVSTARPPEPVRVQNVDYQPTEMFKHLDDALLHRNLGEPPSTGGGQGGGAGAGKSFPPYPPLNPAAGNTNLLTETSNVAEKVMSLMGPGMGLGSATMTFSEAFDAAGLGAIKR